MTTVDGSPSERHDAGWVTRSAAGAAAWWFADVPARRLDRCRRLVFAYAAVWLLVRSRYVWDVAGLPDRQFEPVGVLAGVGVPPDRPEVMAVWAVGAVACALVAVGRGVRVAATLGSIAMLLIATLTSSFGQVFHTEHLVVIHLLVLAAAAWLDPPRGRASAAGTASGWPLNLLMATTAAAYVVAGVAKLRFAGGDWITGDVLRTWVAVDNLRKVLLDDPASTLGGWLAGVAWVWPPIAVATLVVELGAPVALRRGRIRIAWVISAWAFHVGVLALMAISFPYQLSGAAYLAFLPLERLARRRGESRVGVEPQHRR